MLKRHSDLLKQAGRDMQEVLLDLAGSQDVAEIKVFTELFPVYNQLLKLIN